MNRTGQTLLEQMKKTDVEIQRRMELVGLTEEALAQLSCHNGLIEAYIDPLLDEYYEKQTAIDEISMLIGDADTLSRLRNAQGKYVIDLFSGGYDGESVNNRLRIWLVHKRIGVQPTLYIAAISMLKDHVESILRQNLHIDSNLEKVLTILNRLVSFDTTLVFDTYIA
jgi:diguanylate cyclase